MPYFRVPLDVDNKDGDGGYDPVTAADRAAEVAIATHLGRAFPDHGLEGEEFGITGSPMWGTLIGLLEGAQPVLGVMDQPFTGERFWSDGVQSFASRNGEKRIMRTRSCDSLSSAVLMTTDPLLFRAGAERTAFENLRAKVRLTRYGGDCYAYALLASGFVDIIVESGLKPYDIVALIPIVEAAGGRVTEWNGGSAAQGGRIVASGDPALHDAVLAELNNS
jgi:myo-inositol-1(or 4)-monophosphatase